MNHLSAAEESCYLYAAIILILGIVIAYVGTKTPKTWK